MESPRDPRHLALTLRRAFSNLAPTTPIMKAGRTEPCKPTTGMKPRISIAVTSPPDATAWRVWKRARYQHHPKDDTNSWILPNTRKVDQTTKPGKMMKAASKGFLLGLPSSLEASFQERSRVRTPMKRPVATITGMIGTNTSPNVRMARWNQFPCLAASAFMSSLMKLAILRLQLS